MNAIEVLRRYQRHHVLRQFGEDGHVLPECLEVSNAIDELIEDAKRARVTGGKITGGL